MAQENCGNSKSLFTIYCILVLISLITYSVWLYNGDIDNKSASITLIVLCFIAYVLSLFFLISGYKNASVETHLPSTGMTLGSVIMFILLLLFIIINHVITGLKTKETVTVGGVTTEEYVINNTANSAMILGYVGIGIGFISYVMVGGEFSSAVSNDK